MTDSVSGQPATGQPQPAAASRRQADHPQERAARLPHQAAEPATQADREEADEEADMVREAEARAEYLAEYGEVGSDKRERIERYERAARQETD
jgi:hypothetical protein